MKHFTTTFKLLILFVAASLFFPSCDPDDPMDNVIEPSVSLVDETGFISSATTISAGETINVKVSATKGDAEMNSFVVKQDGIDLSTDDFTINGLLPNNPQVLFDAERTSFTYEIAIAPHASGTATYSFEVTGADQSVGKAEVDVTIDDVVIEPELVNNMNASITIQSPGKVQIVLTGTAGSSPLSTLAVYDGDANLVDASRLEWEAEAIDANPYELLAADKSGFTNKKLFLTSSNIVGAQNYTITLADEAGFSSTIAYTINLEPAATPFTSTVSGVRMYNNAGTNPGAIDLETGTNVSSGDASADLVDQGIDGNGNWLQNIKATGAITVRQIENTYTYANVTSRELVIAAYDGGTDVTSSTINLTVGSTLVANMGTTYYIFTVESVNPTSGDNNDYFEFGIKKSSL